MRRTIRHPAVHPRRRETGFTLVETLVAILLMAVVVMSVFSIALTSRTAGKKTSRKAIAGIYTKTVEEKLKSYITGDLDSTTSGPNADWWIPGDACGNCWALAPGAHDMTSILPAVCTPNQPICSGAPANATLTYTVVNQGGCVEAGCRKRVEVKLDWTE